ncbi:M3 family metallopeptidase [Aquimonas sp.]|jgi:oligopeptidase A|uniref:M3 family metallopeptidase n=1 Tax=Aquimonas sp. TaxID=1872588 RepID=UPI0037C09194
MNTPAHNPLLADHGLPDFPLITPAHVLPAVEARIAEFENCVERVLSAAEAPSFESLMAPLERAQAALDHSFAPVGHLHGVADSAELREVYAEAEARITDFSAALGQHRGLFEAVRSLRQSGGFDSLPQAERALVEDSLRDFELSGVALEEPARSRFKAIQSELSRLSTAFEEAVLDTTDAWFKPLTAAELAGLPDSAIAMLKAMGAEREVDGPIATLKGPAVQAVLNFADDRALREAVYTAYQTRASDQGPHDPAHDNSGRIGEILALRHEAAQLLGFASSAHVSLADKMAAEPERVLGFLHALAAKAKPVAEREFTELAAFARAELGIEELQPWDVGYAAEKLRQQRFDYSDEDLKPYFPVDRVLDGMFALAGELYGLKFAARTDVPLWHADARYFDVLDADGKVRAGFYVDLYARSGKRGGAWMDVCRGRIDALEPPQIPVAFLVCNVPPPTPELPALLTHDDVLTLLHEFGHGLHHMLTEVRWPGIGGISGVEWDAVELPSQFMENFGWTRAGIDLLGGHYTSGDKLPQLLFDKMLAARHFHAGLFLVRQLEFALFDFRLHLEFDPARGARALETLEAVRDQVAVIRPPAWQRMPNTFTHVFAGGYAAGYYSYLWAEVLSADAFDAFAAAGVMDAATGLRFRQQVLAVGGSRPALESFIAFRGREPEPDALLRSYGLVA